MSADVLAPLPMRTYEANVKLRRFLELGCECLTTIGWEIARLSLEPVRVAHEQGGLAQLSAGEPARLKTAAAALVSILDAAPAGLHDTARAGLIERASPRCSNTPRRPREPRAAITDGR